GSRKISLVGAFLLLVGLIAGTGAMFRRFDWQHISATHTCRHCVQLHRRVGYGALAADIACAVSLFDLCALPLAAMIYEGSPGATETMTAVVLVLGIAAIVVLIGAVALSLLPRTTVHPAAA